MRRLLDERAQPLGAKRADGPIARPGEAVALFDPGRVVEFQDIGQRGGFEILTTVADLRLDTRPIDAFGRIDGSSDFDIEAQQPENLGRLKRDIGVDEQQVCRR